MRFEYLSHTRHPLSMQAPLSSGDKGLDLGLGLYLLTYLVYASSKVSGKTEHMGESFQDYS